jgi:transcriptional regulator with XRE-family HTH domain
MEQAILKKLKQLRTEREVSPQDLADYLSIDLSAYKRLESGQNKTWGKYLINILEFYKLSPSDFFNDIEGKNFVQHTNTDFKDQANGVIIADKILFGDNEKTLYEELIKSEREQKEYWKTKYYKIKDKLTHLEAEVAKYKEK